MIDLSAPPPPDWPSTVKVLLTTGVWCIVAGAAYDIQSITGALVATGCGFILTAIIRAHP